MPHLPVPKPFLHSTISQPAVFPVALKPKDTKTLPLLSISPCFLCLPLLPSPFLSFLLFLFHTLIGFTLHFLLLLSTLPLVLQNFLDFPT